MNIQNKFKNADSSIDQRMRRYENDFKMILDISISADGAKRSRLEALKSKLDNLVGEVRDEQRTIRNKIIPILIDQRDSIAGISPGITELEEGDEARERILLGIQQRIAALRKEVVKKISTLLD